MYLYTVTCNSTNLHAHPCSPKQVYSSAEVVRYSSMELSRRARWRFLVSYYQLLLALNLSSESDKKASHSSLYETHQ